MCREAAARLPVDPTDGLVVQAQLTLTIYPPQGAFQGRVQRLILRDESGWWRLVFERTRSRLEAEGLFARSRKRRLPRLPERVAVVTSPDSDAWQDIATEIGRRAPWIEVFLAPTRIQGPGAEHDVANAVVRARSVGVDVIIVARGGGSPDDLRIFDSEEVARAVSTCPVPVVSGVGHAGDVTVIDLVADVRAATPSAAAEIVSPDRSEIAGRIDSILRMLRLRMARASSQAESRLERDRTRLDRAAQHRMQLLEQRCAALDPLALRAALHRKVRRFEERVERAGPPALARGFAASLRVREQRWARAGERQLREGIGRALAAAERRFNAAIQRLDALSPLAVLRRGYAVAYDADGRVIRSVRAVRPGGYVDLRLSDGRARLQSVELFGKEG